MSRFPFIHPDGECSCGYGGQKSSSTYAAKKGFNTYERAFQAYQNSQNRPQKPGYRKDTQGIYWDARCQIFKTGNSPQNVGVNWAEICGKPHADQVAAVMEVSKKVYGRKG